MVLQGNVFFVLYYSEEHTDLGIYAEIPFRIKRCFIIFPAGNNIIDDYAKDGGSGEV